MKKNDVFNFPTLFTFAQSSHMSNQDQGIKGSLKVSLFKEMQINEHFHPLLLCKHKDVGASR